MLIAAFLALALIPMTAQAEGESSGVTIELVGPTTLGVGVKQQYKVMVAGGPGNQTGGNYSWSATLGGDMGSKALLRPSVGGPSKTGVFFFNITAPSTSGKFNVEIAVKSFNITTNVTEKLKVNFKAVDPIVLTATVKNSGNVTVNGVPVYFYLNDDSNDPEEIYNTTVTVAALGQKSITYNWTTYDLSKGEHEIKVMVDPDSDLVTLNDGSKESSMTIYYKVSGFGPINAWLWVFVVLLIVLVYIVYRRPAKRKKKRKK